MTDREWNRNRGDWERPRREFLDPRSEFLDKDRDYEHPRHWRDERHEGPNVVDRVRDWWHRLSDEDYNPIRKYEAERRDDPPYEREVISSGHSGWTRHPDWVDRDRYDTSDWDYGRHDRDWRTESYSRDSGASAFGGPNYNYGGGMQVDYRGDRFAGRGPKNWRRSDERIREEVNEELTRHPDVDASDIEVAVISAEITLTGDVDSRFEKREAEECVWRISGVKDVHNQLRLKQGVGSMIAQVFDKDRR